MKHLIPEVSTGEDRQLYSIRHGLLHGCEAYLSKRDRFSVRSGTYEREISSRFSKLAEGSRAFLDIGAAEGFFSIYMLRNTRAKVFAFEVEDDFGDVLLRNIEHNTRDGHRVCFNDCKLGETASPDDGRFTVDRIAASLEGPIMLKIDAEGEEAEILKGAERVMSRDDTSLVVRVNSKHSESQCMWLLDENDFNVEIVGPAWWRGLVKDRNHEENTCRWLIAEKSHFDGLTS